MRLLVCGSREWTDQWFFDTAIVGFFTRLRDENDSLTLIHGKNPRGADAMADEWRECMEVIPFPAEWNRYKKAAGPIRNQRMLEEGKPDLVLAFKKRGAGNKGTSDMVERARAAGVRTYVIEGD